MTYRGVQKFYLHDIHDRKGNQKKLMQPFTRMRSLHIMEAVASHALACPQQHRRDASVINKYLTTKIIILTVTQVRDLVTVEPVTSATRSTNISIGKSPLFVPLAFIVPQSPSSFHLTDHPTRMEPARSFDKHDRECTSSLHFPSCSRRREHRRDDARERPDTLLRSVRALRLCAGTPNLTQVHTTRDLTARACPSASRHS